MYFLIFIHVVLIKEVFSFLGTGSSSLSQSAGYMIVLLQIMFGEFWQWESHPRHTAHQKMNVLRSHPKRKPLSSKPWELIEIWVNLQVTSPLQCCNLFAILSQAPSRKDFYWECSCNMKAEYIIKHDRQVVISKLFLSDPIWLAHMFRMAEDKMHIFSREYITCESKNGLWHKVKDSRAYQRAKFGRLGFPGIYIYYPPWN